MEKTDKLKDLEEKLQKPLIKGGIIRYNGTVTAIAEEGDIKISEGESIAEALEERGYDPVRFYIVSNLAGWELEIYE